VFGQNEPNTVRSLGLPCFGVLPSGHEDEAMPQAIFKMVAFSILLALSENVFILSLCFPDCLGKEF